MPRLNGDVGPKQRARFSEEATGNSLVEGQLRGQLHQDNRQLLARRS
jgi:hypothetical protein